jgi:hypothetical protein
MRRNIVLADNLIEEALKLSGVKTKKDLIHLALKEFVENKYGSVLTQKIPFGINSFIYQSDDYQETQPEEFTKGENCK